MTEHSPVIEFADVAFAFPEAKPIFRTLSLKLDARSFYLIRGPSGTGKSTFLRLINRLEEPSRGHILFKGRRPAAYPPPFVATIHFVHPAVAHPRGRIGTSKPVDGLSFKNNRDLAYPDDNALRSHLDNLLLNGVSLDANAMTLSVGQLQRLCFIRGLLLSPEVLLLDETTSALDAESARILEQTTENLCAEFGLTVVMVSHRPGTVAG